MAEPIAQQLLREVPILHLAYTGLDRGPRVIPLGYLWDGATFRFWTIPGAPKLRALQADPRVAITTDRKGVPPRVLFARGRVALAVVEGVPAGYLEASHRGLPREQWDGFDAQVRSLYDRMVLPEVASAATTDDGSCNHLIARVGSYAVEMVLEHLEIAVSDGQEAAFEAALCEARQRVFMSRGFRGFTVAQGAEQPSMYLVQVLWESPEELGDFTQSRFERCWAPVEPFLAGPLRVHHFIERPSLALNGPGVITDLAWLSE